MPEKHKLLEGAISMLERGSDTVNIKKKDTPLVKFYKYSTIVVGILTASLTLFAFAGQVYNVPSKLEQNSKIIEIHASRIQSLDHDITDINSKVAANANDISQVQRILAEMSAEAKRNAQQNIDINKNLIELNTTIKFLNESIGDIKLDVREVKERTRKN